jgi:hypothetical protein
MPKKRTGTRVPDSLPVRVPGSEIPENPILITDLYKSTENCLKKIGRLDLCLNSSQLDILKELCVFLKEFEKLTLVVSTNVAVLSMIPLMKLRIRRICQIGPDNDDAIK